MCAIRLHGDKNYWGTLCLDTIGIFLEPRGTTVSEQPLHGPAYSENRASLQTAEASLASNPRDDQAARPARRKRASPRGGGADLGRGEVGERSGLAGRLWREDRGLGSGRRPRGMRASGRRVPEAGGLAPQRRPGPGRPPRAQPPSPQVRRRWGPVRGAGSPGARIWSRVNGMTDVLRGAVTPRAPAQPHLHLTGDPTLGICKSLY